MTVSICYPCLLASHECVFAFAGSTGSYSSANMDTRACVSAVLDGACIHMSFHMRVRLCESVHWMDVLFVFACLHNYLSTLVLHSSISPPFVLVVWMLLLLSDTNQWR